MEKLNLFQARTMKKNLNIEFKFPLQTILKINKQRP